MLLLLFIPLNLSLSLSLSLSLTLSHTQTHTHSLPPSPFTVLSVLSLSPPSPRHTHTIQSTNPPERSMSYSVQSNHSFAPVPARSGSHDDHMKHLVVPASVDQHGRRGSGSVNGSIPSIPVPVNRPEMEMLSPLSPDGPRTTSLKAARKPVAGMQAVSGL